MFTIYSAFSFYILLLLHLSGCWVLKLPSTFAEPLLIRAYQSQKSFSNYIYLHLHISVCVSGLFKQFCWIPMPLLMKVRIPRFLFKFMFVFTCIKFLNCIFNISLVFSFMLSSRTKYLSQSQFSGYYKQDSYERDAEIK